MAKKRSRRKGAVPPPKCKAILICERTIIEAGTGKVSLIGLFDGFIVPDVPGTTSPCTVFLHLTDGVADHEYQITIALHDLSDGTVIAKAGGPKVQWKDRLAKLNLFIPVPALRIQHEGKYDFVVFANKQEIDRQTFAVRVPPTPEIQIEGQEDD